MKHEPPATNNSDEYVKTLLQLLEGDKKAVMLYITFSLAVPVLTIKEAALGTGILFSKAVDPALMATKTILTISLTCFLFAAFFHFLYYRRLHLNTFAVAKCLLTMDADEARRIIFDEKNGLWKRHGWKYNSANVLLSCGIMLYLAFFLTMIY